jgi:hypothetical protein
MSAPARMSPYFYSLGMLVNGRAWYDPPEVSAMDVLERAIADDGDDLPVLINFLVRSE